MSSQVKFYFSQVNKSQVKFLVKSSSMFRQSPSPSSRCSRALLRGLSSIKPAPVGAAHECHPHPIRAPPFHENHSDISSTYTNSFRPDLSSYPVLMAHSSILMKHKFVRLVVLIKTMRQTNPYELTVMTLPSIAVVRTYQTSLSTVHYTQDLTHPQHSSVHKRHG